MFKLRFWSTANVATVSVTIPTIPVTTFSPWTFESVNKVLMQ
jgi:hypothetical protein